MQVQVGKAMKKLLVMYLLVYSLPLMAGWPHVALPPHAESKPLADEIVQNGVPMRVLLFAVPMSADKVLDYYRNRWADKYSESEYEAWQQISRMQGKYFITVQVQAINHYRSHGRITISRGIKPATAAEPGSGIPLPAQTDVIQDTMMRDRRNRTRTVLASNHNDVMNNAGFYRRHYQAAGWQTVMDRDLMPRGYALVFRKQQDEITVLVQAFPGGSSIMLNEVRKNGVFNW